MKIWLDDHDRCVTRASCTNYDYASCCETHEHHNSQIRLASAYCWSRFCKITGADDERKLAP